MDLCIPHRMDSLHLWIWHLMDFGSAFCTWDLHKHRHWLTILRHFNTSVPLLDDFACDWAVLKLNQDTQGNAHPFYLAHDKFLTLDTSFPSSTSPRPQVFTRASQVSQ